MFQAQAHWGPGCSRLLLSCCVCAPDARVLTCYVCDERHDDSPRRHQHVHDVHLTIALVPPRAVSPLAHKHISSLLVSPPFAQSHQCSHELYARFRESRVQSPPRRAGGVGGCFSRPVRLRLPPPPPPPCMEGFAPLCGCSLCWLPWQRVWRRQAHNHSSRSMPMVCAALLPLSRSSCLSPFCVCVCFLISALSAVLPAPLLCPCRGTGRVIASRGCSRVHGQGPRIPHAVRRWLPALQWSVSYVCVRA